MTTSKIKEARFGLYNGPNLIRKNERITEYTGQESRQPIHAKTANLPTTILKGKLI